MRITAEGRKQVPAHGDTRVVRRFAALPIVVTGEDGSADARWLRRVTVAERYAILWDDGGGRPVMGWVPERFVDWRIRG